MPWPESPQKDGFWQAGFPSLAIENEKELVSSGPKDKQAGQFSVGPKTRSPALEPSRHWAVCVCAGAEAAAPHRLVMASQLLGGSWHPLRPLGREERTEDRTVLRKGLS